MNDERLKYSDYKDTFYDEFGNRINNFIIEKYYKTNNGWFIESYCTTHHGSDYVVDGKLYFESNGSLIPLNMDFDSLDCGACYKIVGEDKTQYRKIVANEYLCENKYLDFRLHKQSYSDGTCYYSLKNSRGQSAAGYGSRNLTDVISQLKNKVESDKMFLNVGYDFKEDILQTEQFIKEVEDILIKEVEDYTLGLNLNDYELGGVELTEDDYIIIAERLKTGAESLEKAVDERLCEIREVLDMGLDTEPKEIAFEAGYYEWNVFLNGKIFYSFDVDAEDFNDLNTDSLKDFVSDCIETMQEALKEEGKPQLEEKYIYELKGQMVEKWGYHFEINETKASLTSKIESACNRSSENKSSEKEENKQNEYYI